MFGCFVSIVCQLMGLVFFSLFVHSGKCFVVAGSLVFILNVIVFQLFQLFVVYLFFFKCFGFYLCMCV